jgi:hypothetical protein
MKTTRGRVTCTICVYAFKAIIRRRRNNHRITKPKSLFPGPVGSTNLARLLTSPTSLRCASTKSPSSAPTLPLHLPRTGLLINRSLLRPSLMAEFFSYSDSRALYQRWMHDQTRLPLEELAPSKLAYTMIIGDLALSTTTNQTSLASPWCVCGVLHQDTARRLRLTTTSLQCQGPSCCPSCPSWAPVPPRPLPVPRPGPCGMMLQRASRQTKDTIS